MNSNEDEFISINYSFKLIIFYVLFMAVKIYAHDEYFPVLPEIFLKVTFLFNLFNRAFRCITP